MGGRFSSYRPEEWLFPVTFRIICHSFQVHAGVAVHIRPLLFSGTSIPVLYSVHSVIRRTYGVVK